jgi:hypothetical protein
VERLTTLIHKKKTEILIPEIKTVGPVTNESGSMPSAAIDSKKASNEESASTSHSTNGDPALRPLGPGAQPAPAAAKQAKPGAAPQQSMRDSQVESYLNYKPVFKQPLHYIKYKEPVYEGFENFTFAELNYEVSEKDLKFLESGVVECSVPDFERIIDVFEKIVALDQQQSLVHIMTRFYEKAPKDIAQRIQKQTLEIVYQKVSCEPIGRVITKVVYLFFSIIIICFELNLFK